jgi:regulator of sigma E protease
MPIFFIIIAVIIVFSVLVLVHEFGHFIVARRNGIKVLEFGMGFPPRAWGKKIGETIYSINWIPFGGFVRLLGEEASDKSAAKLKQSFSSKSAWIRTKVIVAGVVMNFLLAILLLTIGFSFGIEPLMVNEEDIYRNLAEGNITAETGVFVGKISDQAKGAGLSVGDKILAINEKAVTDNLDLAIFQKNKADKDVDLTVLSKDCAQKKIHLAANSKAGTYGIDLKPFTGFPHMLVAEVAVGGNAAKAGIRKGDVFLKINGNGVYSQEEFEQYIRMSPTVNAVVLRDNKEQNVTFKLPDARRVVVGEVIAGSIAEKAGFKAGDVIAEMDGIAVSKIAEVQGLIKKNFESEVAYSIVRGSEKLVIKAKPGKDKLIGISLALLNSFRNAQFSTYAVDVVTSITEIKPVRYAPWKALQTAVSESARLSVLTVDAFRKTLVSIFSKFVVPAEVGGPVQIAVYTKAFLEEGFFAMLRFMAMLSLSLAVLNILPIPALDGGKFLFILIEVITRRKVNPRFESMVHAAGFVLLLIFIGFVTFNDIVRLF